MKKLLLFVGLVALAVAEGRAWMEPLDEVLPQVDEVIDELVARRNTFSARLHITTVSEGEPPAEVDLFVAARDGKVRIELALEDGLVKQMDPGERQMIKRMGFDKFIELRRPDLKQTLAIFPLIQASAIEPSEPPEVKERPTFKKAGQEKVGTHPCTVMTAGESLKVWEAEDLEKFPVRLVLREDETRFEVDVKDVDLGKPDAWLFEVPAGFQKYEDLERLLEDRMREVMPEGMPPDF